MRARLWAATALTWVAAHVAPREMRPVFLAYCQLLGDMPAQIEMGRRWGIVTAQWSLERDGLGKASRLQRAAIAAATRARGRIYAEEAEQS